MRTSREYPGVPGVEASESPPGGLVDLAVGGRLRTFVGRFPWGCLLGMEAVVASAVAVSANGLCGVAPGKGLGQIIVHAGSETAGAIAVHRIRGQAMTGMRCPPPD